MLKYKTIPKKREKLGLSPAQFSRITGIRPDILSRIEHGKQMNPTLRTLEALAAGLQVKVADLIDDENATI